jgi:hypothetical protein
LVTNWKRGLNRIFVLLCVVWAIVALVVIPAGIAKSNAEFAAKTEQFWANLSDRTKTPEKVAQHEKQMEALWEEATVQGVYEQWPWYGILAGLVIPPLLFYAVCWIVIRSGRWIRRGFREAG